MDTQELKLKKAHIRLMRHPETCLYSGVMLMGESSVVDDCPTAYTDGKNKKYGRKFLEQLSVEETAALALHENLHVLLKHIPRHRDLMKQDARLANMAMDYVVNDIIVNLKDKTLCKLPEGGLYDPQFHEWSVRQVYDFLKKEQQQGGGGSRSKSTLDEHDDQAMQEATPEQLKKLSDEVSQALQEGAMLAGKMGIKLPRVISDAMQPEVDWRDALREFVSSMVRGNDEQTWRRLNRKRLSDDIYMPSTYSERPGEIVIAIDTSGSIGDEILAEFAGEVASICENVTPDMVRVVWWDTKVHGEQVFQDNYDGIVNMLKPQGGGGTRVACVSEYLIENNYSPDCVVVFTDGYVESEVKWDTTAPTLWMVTRNKTFTPPTGQMVKVK